MYEFPDDVLSLIRAYAKPVFSWFKEFKEAPALNLCADHLQKLKTKMDDPVVRDQLKVCVDAYADHKQSYDTLVQKRNPMNEERESKKDWWKCVSLEKLVALLDDREFRGRNYAEWYFKEQIDDAWMDSDLDSDSDSVWSYYQHEDEWADLNYEDEWWHLQMMESIYPEISLLFE